MRPAQGPYELSAQQAIAVLRSSCQSQEQKGEIVGLITDREQARSFLAWFSQYLEVQPSAEAEGSYEALENRKTDQKEESHD